MSVIYELVYILPNSEIIYAFQRKAYSVLEYIHECKKSVNRRVACQSKNHRKISFMGNDVSGINVGNITPPIILNLFGRLDSYGSRADSKSVINMIVYVRFVHLPFYEVFL